jgi:hypothetical protein
MEWLATCHGDGNLLQLKDFFLCPADCVDDLPDKIEPNSQYFSLFIAMDAWRLDDGTILEVAKRLLSKGFACLCAWGPNCERVRDLFDSAAREINDELSGDDVIMTSWHASGPLEEALWFFVHSAFVTTKFEKTCTDWVLAPIANPGWEQLMRNRIQEIITVSEDNH